MKTVHLMTTGSLGHKFSFPGQIELPSLTVKIHRPNETEVSWGYNKLSKPAVWSLCASSIFGSCGCGRHWELVKRDIMSHNPAGSSAASQKGHQFNEVVNILVVDLFFSRGLKLLYNLSPHYLYHNQVNALWTASSPVYIPSILMDFSD